tara:strand:+ start:511 stop:750 length:240 start_codon:yes stop_codon:yes gene_type:complete
MSLIKETNLDKVYPTRREMIDYLITQYPQFYSNEDYQIKSLFLNEKIKCPCTDCGGDDSTTDCKLEYKYFEEINNIVFL